MPARTNYTLSEVLKKDWGFKGFVVSDWGGTHSTVKAAMAGLDMEMPGNDSFGAPLKKAVESGEVPHGAARTTWCIASCARSSPRASVDDPPQPEVVRM